MQQGSASTLFSTYMVLGVITEPAKERVIGEMLQADGMDIIKGIMK